MNWNGKRAYVRSALVASGLFYLITAAALVFAPVWFFDNIGNYPPYNRHYQGDAGTFVLGLGLILLWAWRDPARYRAMIALVGVGSLAHACNHVIDDFILNPSALSIGNNVVLFIFAAAQFLAAWWAVPEVFTHPALHNRVKQGSGLELG